MVVERDTRVVAVELDEAAETGEVEGVVGPRALCGPEQLGDVGVGPGALLEEEIEGQVAVGVGQDRHAGQDAEVHQPKGGSHCGRVEDGVLGSGGEGLQVHVPGQHVEDGVKVGPLGDHVLGGLEEHLQGDLTVGILAGGQRGVLLVAQQQRAQRQVPGRGRDVQRRVVVLVEIRQNQAGVGVENQVHLLQVLLQDGIQQPLARLAQVP